jgi:hypothetical protein
MKRTFSKVIWFYRGRQMVRMGLSVIDARRMVNRLETMPGVRDIRCYSYTENHGETDVVDARPSIAGIAERPISPRHI